MHYLGIFNGGSGTFRTMDMAAFSERATACLAAHGHSLAVQVVDGDGLLRALSAAVTDPGCDALLVGGGDGTISAAAEACFRGGKPLAVLPAGTMNLFARSLGVPLGLDAALVALAAGTVQRVDIATANGRPFVHQYSVGIHTRLVRLREQFVYKSRWGKIVASFRAIVRAVSRPPVFWAEIRTARGVERRKATGVTVTNNVLGEGHVPHADHLDRGVLGVYVLKPMRPLALARLCLDVMRGRWKASPLLSEREVEAVTLTFPQRKSTAQALVDGELLPLAARVELAIHPLALQVVMPQGEVALAAAE